MDEFITTCCNSGPEEWSKAWVELQIPRQAEKEMLTLLFEVDNPMTRHLVAK